MQLQAPNTSAIFSSTVNCYYSSRHPILGVGRSCSLGRFLLLRPIRPEVVECAGFDSTAQHQNLAEQSRTFSVARSRRYGSPFYHAGPDRATIVLFSSPCSRTPRPCRRTGDAPSLTRRQARAVPQLRLRLLEVHGIDAAGDQIRDHRLDPVQRRPPRILRASRSS